MDCHFGIESGTDVLGWGTVSGSVRFDWNRLMADFQLGAQFVQVSRGPASKTPDNFDVDEFKNAILAIDGVNAIDDFHIWSLDGIDSVMTLKVDVDFGKDVENIKKEIYAISNRYHVVDITIELE